MKKKIVSLFLVVAMVITVTSCTNNNATAISSVDDTQPVILEEPSEIVEIAEIESEIESESEVVEEDPLAVLEVSEEFAKANQLLCLYRDGKLYSLDAYITSEKSMEYGLGYRQFDNMAWTTKQDESYVLTIGDFPEVVFVKGEDELRQYAVGSIKLYQDEFIGYSIAALNIDGGIELFPDYGNPKSVYLDFDRYTGVQQFEIHDDDNNLVDDFHSLEKNKPYTVSWFESINYNEYIMNADCKCYRKAKDPCCMIDGILTKDGYVMMDLSDVPSGSYNIYKIPTGRFPITIQ